MSRFAGPEKRIRHQAPRRYCFGLVEEQEPISVSPEAPAEDRQTFKTTCRQFWLISKAFFASERRHKARGFLMVLLALALAVGGVQVLMSYAGRDFMTAIIRKNPAAYWAALGWYLGTFALAVPIGVFYRWVEERLALLWREWMAQHLVKRYFNNRAYFRLRGSESVDNPDQRISEDVRNFTTSSLSFLLILLNSLVTLIAFIGVLWMISGTLVVMLVAYAVAGTAISIAIGRKLVRLHYHQYEKEANFRYGLVRVRDNAESIAFYRGEKREHLDLFNRLAGSGDQHAPDHHPQPEARVFHQQLQLPRAGPARPGRRADVHARAGGVRRRHPGGGGLRPGVGGVLADHHAVRRIEHLSGERPASRQPVGPTRRA